MEVDQPAIDNTQNGMGMPEDANEISYHSPAENYPEASNHTANEAMNDAPQFHSREPSREGSRANSRENSRAQEPSLEPSRDASVERYNNRSSRDRSRGRNHDKSNDSHRDNNNKASRDRSDDGPAKRARRYGWTNRSFSRDRSPERRRETYDPVTSEPIDKRKVFVGNISRNVEKETLMRKFEKFGRVEDVEPHGRYAYIYFAEVEDAEIAVREMHHYVIDGHKINCEHHQPFYRTRRNFGNFRRDDNYQNYGPYRKQHTKYRIIVQPLDSRCTWQELKDYGRLAGSVSFANVYNHGSKKVGLIEYSNRSDQKAAIDQLANKYLNNRQVRIEEDYGQLDHLFQEKNISRPVRDSGYNRYEDRYRDSGRHHEGRHGSPSPGYGGGMGYKKNNIDDYSQHARANGRGHRVDTSSQDYFRPPVIKQYYGPPRDEGVRTGYSDRRKEDSRIHHRTNSYDDPSSASKPTPCVDTYRHTTATQHAPPPFYADSPPTHRPSGPPISPPIPENYIDNSYSHKNHYPQPPADSRQYRDARHPMIEPPSSKHSYYMSEHHHDRDMERHHTSDRHRYDDDRYYDKRDRRAAYYPREQMRGTDRRRSRSPPRPPR